MKLNFKVACFVLFFPTVVFFSSEHRKHWLPIRCSAAFKSFCSGQLPGASWFPLCTGFPRQKDPARLLSLLSFFIFEIFCSCCFLMPKSWALEGVQGQIQKCTASSLISHPQSQLSSHLGNRCYIQRVSWRRHLPFSWLQPSQQENVGCKLAHTHSLTKPCSLESRLSLTEHYPHSSDFFFSVDFRSVYQLLREIRIIASLS